MRFEKSVEVAASHERVWEVLSDIGGWPRVVQAVEVAEEVTPPPLAVGSTIRLRETGLPEGLWEITSWDPPGSFELTQKAGGVTSVVDHVVERVDEGTSRLTLVLEMRGLPIAVFGVLFRKRTQAHLDETARDLKLAAELPEVVE